MAEIASQGEIFFSGPGSAGGLRKLTKVKDFKPDDEAETSVPTAIGVTRGAGYRRKQGGFKISMSVYPEVGKVYEVDYFQLADDQVEVTFITQDEGNGQRRAYYCKVSKVNDGKDSEGNYEWSVELACRTTKRNP